MSVVVPEFRMDWPGEELLEEWPEGLPPHFSPSQIKLARKCMEQYRQRYVLGIKTPPQKALLWGRADHAAQEHNFRQKVESGEDCPLDDVLDAFRDSVFNEIDAEGGPSEINWDGRGADAVVKEIVDDGTRLAGLYHQELAPKVQPIAVEQPSKLLIPGLPVPVSFVLDVLEEGRIVDAKTTSSSKQVVSNENELQGRIYSAATDLPTFFQLKVKPKSPGGGIKVLEANRDGKVFAVYPSGKDVTMTAVRRTLAMVAFCMKTYGPDNPWPDALAHDWACSYCGYRDANRCPYWK